MSFFVDSCLHRNTCLSTMAEVGSPSLENLPKVDADLKSELEGFKPELMKKASTQEKIVLPTAEGIYYRTTLFYCPTCFQCTPQKPIL